MVPREPMVLTLGGDAFTIRPLTLAQVEQVEEAVGAKDRNATGRAARIIAAALARDHADVGLDDLEVTMPEAMAAMSAILRLGGFIETPLGEAPAAAGNALPGALSEVG